MKKILILISLMFASSFINAQVSNTENYIQSRTYLEPVTASSSTAEQINTLEYYDGLGRPKQVINVKGAPSGKDIVTHIEYDGFGRQVDSWLPVPMTTQNGGVQSSVTTAIKTYYNDIFPHTHLTLEQSPLNRPLSQLNQGLAWQSNPITMGYEANLDGEVKKYTATFNYTSSQSSLVVAASYGNNKLYKKLITDEDGNKTIEFKNGEGQILVVRKVISSGVYADTYYIYNNYNQLAYIISPKAADQIKNLSVGSVVPDDILNRLCYKYVYDRRNRLVEKKLPGKGKEYMVYDKANRLVLSRDSKMALDGRWMINKYDKFGRLLYTGIISGGTRESRQTEADALTVIESRSTSGFTLNGLQVEYTNSMFTGIETILSVNYYDSYPIAIPSVLQTLPNQPINDNINADINTKGMLLASFVKNLEDDAWTKNYHWYDNKGRSIITYSENHLGGYTLVESELEFSGIPKKTYTTQIRKPGESGVSVQERFNYDSQKRMTHHYHQVHTEPEVLLSEKIYNDISQLITNKVGNDLQIIDYAYNIRGWMTHINKDQMTIPNLGNKLFSYEIKYNQKNGITNPDNTLFSGKNVMAKFNGNIAEVDWRMVDVIGTNPPITPKRYGYAYDKQNRLTAGYYQNPNNAYSIENTESLDYDLNGNISELKRTSVVEYGSTVATNIDNLIYHYSGNDNTLSSVEDYSFNNTGYEGGGATIAYDINGNMELMPDKNISIEYNILNLPKLTLYQQEHFDFSSIVETYGSNGVKLRKVHSKTISGINGNTTTKSTVDYLDGFQYTKGEYLSPPPIGGGGGGSSSSRISETDIALERQAFNPDTLDPEHFIIPSNAKTPDLQFFPTAEGYYDYLKNQYIYQYKDYLGNSRVSFGRNSQGNIEITDENDYYPLGMNHLKTGTSNIGHGSYKNYKYNGKEIQETGMYDYGQRSYMSDIGRFNRTDRFSEKYTNISPYAYAAGNPLKYIDVMGDSLIIRHRDNDILFENGRLYNRDGTAYQGPGVKVKKNGSIQLTGFLKSVVTSLNELRSGNAGDSAVRELQNSTHDYTIVQSHIGNSYNDSKREILWDTSSRDGGIDQRGNTRRPIFLGLGHEIGHAIDHDRGTLSRVIDAQFGFMTTEKFATHIENQIRSEHTIPLRTHYGQDANGTWQGSLINTVNGVHESRFYPGSYYGGPTPMRIQPAPIIIPVIPKIFNP